MMRSLFLSVLAIGVLCTHQAAQSPGSVYTSDRNGTVVNGNLYKKKSDVYLSGGPGPNAPCSAGGLPDGNYYFQVTNPSGSVLLSQDAITAREVVVQGGVIVASVNQQHASRNGPCGSRIVQLIPYLDTTSQGNEYKVWLTRVENWDPAGGGHFGFRSARSKTDNFKVQNGQPAQQSIICGYKWYDHSEDGVWNPGVDPLEVPLPGWRVELWLGSALLEYTYTDESGRYCFIRELDNTVYTIREVAPGGFIGDNVPGAVWLAVTPRSGTVTANAPTIAGPGFGNLSFEVKPGVGRTKGFWHNANGEALRAASDPLWRQVLYVHNNLPVGLRTNVSTNDPNLSLLIPPLPTVTSPPPAFFGLSFAAASNRFNNWIVGDPALGHAGFILSTQVAATILNRRCGFMQFTVYVDRFQNGILVSLDEMLAGATGLLRDPGAGLTGPNDPNQALRTTMLNCTNEFGSINETGDLSASQVVYGSKSTPSIFSSPY
jgi:hypothetical protein